MNELIKRLRVQAKLTRHYCPHEKMKTLEENAADAIEKLQAQLEQTRKERDAIAKELFNLAVTVETKCQYCKHNYTITCGVCSNGSKWEWRGIQEA